MNFALLYCTGMFWKSHDITWLSVPSGIHRCTVINYIMYYAWILEIAHFDSYFYKMSARDVQLNSSPTWNTETNLLLKLKVIKGHYMSPFTPRMQVLGFYDSSVRTPHLHWVRKLIVLVISVETKICKQKSKPDPCYGKTFLIPRGFAEKQRSVISNFYAMIGTPEWKQQMHPSS